MGSLTTLQLIFIIVTPVVVIFLICLFVIYPLYKKKKNIKFKEYYYRKIYQIAMEKDYYLINNFCFISNDNKKIVVDHILLANKYIYVIMDYHVDGHLSGNQNDPNIIINLKTGEKIYLINPLLQVKDVVFKLSNYTSLDYPLFIGIALINSEYNIGIINNSSNNYIIQRNKLDKLISAIESRDIGDINEDQLSKAVLELSKIKERNKEFIENVH